MKFWNQWWYRQNFQLLTDWSRSTRKLVAWIRAEIRSTSWTREIDQTLLQCSFSEEYWQRTILHYTWWRRTWRHENIMSRVHLTPKWGNIPRERVDSWNHKDRPSPGCEGLLTSRTLRCWDHDRIFNSRPNSVLGFASWTESINAWPKCQMKLRWERRYRETCREGRATTKADFNNDSSVYSLSWTKMDRRWTSKIQPRLFRSVKIHDQITATWRFSSSRRWWSSKIWRPGRKVQGKFEGTSQWTIEAWIAFLAKGEGPKIIPNISCISQQSRDIQEVLSLMLHCKKMYCCQMTSPSTSTMSGTLTTCTPWSWTDWFQEEEVSKGTDSQCFSQPWTRCAPIKIRKKFHTIWTNPELRCAIIRGEFTQIQGAPRKPVGWASEEPEEHKRITANGEVQMHEEATVCVKELDIFLTMKVLENTPAVLSLGKLCDEHGYSYEWITGQKSHLIKNGIRTQCNTENFVPIVVPGLSKKFFLKLALFNINDTFKAGNWPSCVFLKLVYIINHDIFNYVQCGIDSYPVTVSSKHVERREQGDLLSKTTKNKKQNKKKRRPLSRTERPLPFRHTGKAARVRRKSCGWQSSWTQRLARQFFSWTIFRAYACEKCGFG